MRHNYFFKLIWINLSLTILILTSLSKPLYAHNNDHYFLGFNVFGSFLTDIHNESNNGMGFGESYIVGARIKNIGSYFKIGTDRWIASEIDIDIKKGVLNFALGIEVFLFKKHLKLSLEAGSSTLRFDTAFNDKGTTGIYFGFNPGSLRWSVGKKKRLVLEFTPIMVAVQKPVFKEPDLLRLEYRTIFGVEVLF